MASDLTHFDEHGAARMVDVGDKPVSQRMARASARVRMREETLQLITGKQVSKGDVFQIARVAGIMAAKRTGDLIPLCHPLGLDAVGIEFVSESPTSIRIEVTAKTSGKTGVEMEALTAASVAALTIYDMVKAVDRAVTIGPIQLEEKSGGKSGHYLRASATSDGEC
ncbi:MAG TPA: cyclic pyranopterin monophosphate synthase MoaC [Pirellulaceae bacterium]|nr:cyclic pyranopterin monophosphate synthase MoaC [Pirellulaceae bacterium]